MGIEVVFEPDSAGIGDAVEIGVQNRRIRFVRLDQAERGRPDFVGINSQSGKEPSHERGLARAEVSRKKNQFSRRKPSRKRSPQREHFGFVCGKV